MELWNTRNYNYKYMWNYGTLEPIIISTCGTMEQEPIIISTWGTMEQVIWVFRRKKEDIMTR